MKSQELQKFKGEVLLRLLSIESERCKAKDDEDERTDSLAQLLEGSDHVVERIRQGMEKYVSLVNEEVKPVAAPVAAPPLPRLLAEIQSAILQQGFPLELLSLENFVMTIDHNTGQPRATLQLRGNTYVGETTRQGVSGLSARYYDPMERVMPTRPGVLPYTMPAGDTGLSSYASISAAVNPMPIMPANPNPTPHGLYEE